MPGFVELFVQSGGDADREPWTEVSRPEWIGPPEDELGVMVPVATTLARSKNGVITLFGITAHSSGAVVDLVAAARGLPERDVNAVFQEQHVANRKELPDGFLRVGFELANGSRASNLDDPHRFFAAREEPDGPVLVQCGGGGGTAGGSRVVMKPAYWLWPLPPRGPLRISVEWPLLEIELTTTELDATPIVDAASRAQRLWPD